MKILMPRGHGATAFYRSGYAKAFRAAGFETYIWHQEPAFDVFNQVNPDIVFCGTWELNKDLLKCIKRWNCKVWLWGSTHGDFCSEVDLEDTVQMPTLDEVQNVKTLLNTNKVNRIFHYYHDKYSDYTHNFWTRDCGLEPKGLLLAADIFDYFLGRRDESLVCDVAFVGGLWDYKAKYIHEYIYQLSQDKVNLKVFGTGNWRIPEHLGVIDTVNVSHLYASAKYCINIFEPLSVKYGIDVNERSYKILSAGGLCLSQHVESAENDIFVDGEVEFFENYQELRELMQYYDENLEEYLNQVKRGIHSVYSKHTYLHRVSDLLKIENMDNEYIARLNGVIKDTQAAVSRISGVKFD